MTYEKFEARNEGTFKARKGQKKWRIGYVFSTYDES